MSTKNSMSEIVDACIVMFVILLFFGSTIVRFGMTKGWLRSSHPTASSYTVLEIPNLLTEDECDQIIAAARATGLSTSRVVDPSTGRPALQDDHRHSEQAWFGDAVIPAVNRLSAAVRAWTGAPATHQEPLQVVRYRVGGRFREHHDACSYDKPEICAVMNGTAGQRRATLLVYLNAGYLGGETVFPLIRKTVRPVKGKGLLFWNTDDRGTILMESLHGGLPVQRGEKWIAGQGMIGRGGRRSHAYRSILFATYGPTIGPCRLQWERITGDP